MKKVPKANYRNANEIEAVIRKREADAAALEPGAARQSILIEIAQLRAYASMKRWVGAPDRQAGGARARIQKQV